MEFITNLWMPILISGVAVWIVSALCWMAIGHHNKDRKQLPNEKEFIDTIHRMGIPPGNYGFPDYQTCKNKTKEEKQAMMAEWDKHPMGLLTVWSKFNMGANMAFTFLFFLLTSAVIAYLAWAVLPHGAASVTIPGAGTDTGPSLFSSVFRVTATAAVLAYCFATFPNDLWFQKSRRAMVMNWIDGVIYALITGAIFAWLWPK